MATSTTKLTLYCSAQRHDHRIQWYSTLARGEEDKKLYDEALRTNLHKRIVLLDDLRRCDEHRTGWMNKKTKKKIKVKYNIKDDESTWKVGVDTKKNY